jgi:hypothetical protein
MRFDEFCRYGENMHNCDDEDATSVGPIHHLNEKDVFYFSYSGNLTSSRYEFHRNVRAKHAYDSFIYMLKRIDHVNIQHIMDYLEHDTVVNLDGSMGL